MKTQTAGRDLDALSALDVRLTWASHNVWKAGQKHEGPVHAHTLWLMLYGHAQIGDGAHTWDARQDDIFLWPRGKHRHILARADSGWLSLGLVVTAIGQADILSLLPLPALHPLETDESLLLHSWFRQIIDLREAQSLALFAASPSPPDPAQIFGVRHDIVSQEPHQIWMQRVVAERASLYDVIEKGLSYAVTAWCWKMWGAGDLKRALLHQSPAWLQNTLQLARENPAFSVEDLARAAGFSSAHFRRLFHKNMGQSPRDYLLHQRLEFARELLESTASPVPTIAAQSGFSSVSQFTQMWKSVYGVPPHHYRLSQNQGKGRNF